MNRNSAPTTTNDDLSIEERVTDELIRRGHAATYEYPGFVLIADADGSTWATGTANTTWTVDHNTDDGATSLPGAFDTKLDCETMPNSDAAAIAIVSVLEILLDRHGYNKAGGTK